MFIHTHLFIKSFILKAGVHIDQSYCLCFVKWYKFIIYTTVDFSCFSVLCCSYRKVPGDSCSGGDVESRLDGEMLPCPVGGETALY